MDRSPSPVISIANRRIQDRNDFGKDFILYGSFQNEKANSILPDFDKDFRTESSFNPDQVSVWSGLCYRIIQFQFQVQRPIPFYDHSTVRFHRMNARTAGATLLLFILIALVGFSSAIRGEFLYDDYEDIEMNPNIKTLWPLTTPLLDYHKLPVRPIPYLTFAINFALHGLDTFGYHLTNILIHAFTGWIIFRILESTFSRVTFPEAYRKYSFLLSLVIGLLWLTHPLQTMGVYYIYQRIELLFSFFLVLTLWGLIGLQAAQQKVRTPGNNATVYSWCWMTMSVVSCGLGMASKEVMVVAPFLLLWYDRVFLASRWNEIWQQRKFYYGLLASTWLVLIGILYHQSQNYLEFIALDTTRWQYLLTESQVIPYYLKLTLWPAPLVFDYEWPIAQKFSEVGASFCFMLILFGITLTAIRYYPRWSFIGGWFFLILAPSSSIQPVAAPIFEYRMYLPVLAPITLIVLLLFESYRRTSNIQLRQQISNFAPVVFWMIVGVYLIVDWSRGIPYRTAVGIWRDTTIKLPNSSRAWIQLSDRYYRTQQFQATIETAENAIKLDPGHYMAHYNLGVAYFELKQMETARVELQKALELNSDFASVYVVLGMIDLQENNIPQAISEFERAYQMDSTSSEISTKLALAYIMTNQQLPKANELLVYALRIRPENAEAHNNLGVLYAMQNQMPSARYHFEQALKYRPDYPDAQMNYEKLMRQVGP
jgi:Tfp pilus assembly protein PilF